MSSVFSGASLPGVMSSNRSHMYDLARQDVRRQIPLEIRERFKHRKDNRGRDDCSINWACPRIYMVMDVAQAR